MSQILALVDCNNFYVSCERVFHPGLRFVFIMLAATSFFIRPVIELMPGISARVFEAGPQGLSLLLSSIGAGALVASLWLARRGQTAGLTKLLISSTIVTGISLTLRHRLVIGVPST